jgi:hypothetical protein
LGRYDAANEALETDGFAYFLELFLVALSLFV